jgi:hypothetical protein
MRLTYLVKNQPVRLIKIQPAPTAIAAKNARLAWAVLKYGEDFRLNASAV